MSRSVRPCVCVCVSVTKRLGFGALDGVCRTSPRLLYSVGDCSMIQLNDSESLVSVLEVFSDHRARPPTGHTNLVRFPCMGPNPCSGSERPPGGGWAEKSKNLFLPYRSVLVLRVLQARPSRPTPPPGFPDRPEPFTTATHSWLWLM